jgi:hypothetical protein
MFPFFLEEKWFSTYETCFFATFVQNKNVDSDETNAFASFSRKEGCYRRNQRFCFFSRKEEGGIGGCEQTFVNS